MQTRNIIMVLRVMAVLVGVELVFFNPDLEIIKHTSIVDVMVVKIAGALLVMAGIFIPAKKVNQLGSH